MREIGLQDNLEKDCCTHLKRTKSDISGFVDHKWYAIPYFLTNICFQIAIHDKITTSSFNLTLFIYYGCLHSKTIKTDYGVREPDVFHITTTYF